MPVTLPVPPDAARGLTKAATGDAATFEKSLAAIGRASLGAKAPSLARHEIGFQVLDSDEDNTRAVGVFGFRVGDRILYTPLFYRDGVVKGTEQLRDPKRKVTVPLSDNWVNKYLHDRGDEPPARLNRAQARDTSQPSLWQLKYPPSKYAADLAAVRDTLVRDLAGVIGRKPAPLAGEPLDLLKEAAAYPELLAGVGRLARTYGWFSDALLRYHGAAKVAAALQWAKTAHALPAPAAEPAEVVPARRKAAKVSVVRVRMLSVSRAPLSDDWDFDPETLGELSAGRNAYKDRRSDGEKTKVTAWLGGEMPDGETISNPTASGVYKVLTTDHTFDDCVVLMPLVGWGPSVGRCVVYRLKDKAWAYAHPNGVWCRGQAEHPAFTDWAEGLKKVGPEVPQGMWVGLARYTKGSDAGGGAWVATTPFSTDGGGAAYPLPAPDRDRPFWSAFDPYRDDFRDACCDDAAAAGDPLHKPNHNTNIHFDIRKSRQPKRVEVYAEASKPLLSGSQLYLPEDCRLLSLSGGPRLGLGDGSDPERYLAKARKQAGDTLLELRKTASGLRVGPLTLPDAAEAEAYLVVRHGLAVPDARRLAQTAWTQKAAAAFVKYADDYDMGLAHNWPNAPVIAYDQIAAPAGFADDVLPTETGASLASPIQDLLMQPGAADRYKPYPTQFGVKVPLPGVGNEGNPPEGPEAPGPSADDLRTVAGAADSGKRELFDTATLAALVKNTRLSTLRNRVLGRLTKAVSDLGDLLAHMYWNVDEWTEQFGDSEVGPLEDQIRDQFEGLGELVLMLQEKAVEEGFDPGILPEARPGDGADTDS